MFNPILDESPKSGIISEDIEGQKFGRLTAIRFVEKKRGYPYWLFKCDCGKEKVIAKYGVIYRGVKGCGCSRGKWKR